MNALVLAFLLLTQMHDVFGFSEVAEVTHLVGITEYPVLAAAAKIQGHVTVTCELRVDGTVSGCRAASGPEILSRQASANALLWQFRALSGKARPASIDIEYVYTLVGTGTRGFRKVDFSFEVPNHVYISAELPCADHGPCPEH